jgi:ribose/xylose/arabinose/galactoside ABC-type transport system permease subunit
MVGLNLNHVLTLLIGAALGLAMRLFSSDAPRSPPATRDSWMRFPVWLSLLPALNAYRYSGLFPALAVANLVVTIAAIAWILGLQRLARRHAWAEAWARAPVLSIASICAVLTYLAWLLQDVRRWDFSWLTLANLPFAICAAVGLLVGACIPMILRISRLAP